MYNDSNSKMKHKIEKFLRQDYWLVIIIAVASLLFVYAWFMDGSKPFAGSGWADQNTYTISSQELGSFSLPSEASLHFAIGYPLLGLTGFFLEGPNRFVVSSYSLLILSMIFLYFGAKKLTNTTGAILFSALILYWDFNSRSMSYVVDLFAIPWNNQVFFFVFAYFFWLLARKDHKPNTKLALVSSAVAGLSVLTREETILFVLPLMAGYLLITKSNLKIWIFSAMMGATIILPQLLVKYAVFGSIGESGHDSSYSETAQGYFQPTRLYRNIREVVVDSGSYTTNPKRPALLQSMPWLWVAPAGLLILLVSSRYPLGIKVYTIVSLGLLLFYLSGTNMSGYKLMFHCLRYVSPALIILNFSVVVVLRESFRFLRGKSNQLKKA